MFIFYYDTFSVGGAETMMARMCKWAILHGEKAFVVCRYKKGDGDWIDDLLRDSCTGFIIDSNLNTKRIANIIYEHCNDDELIFFCTMSVFPCREFVYMIRLAKKIKNVKFINFAITTIEERKGLSFLDDITNKLFLPFLQNILDNHIFIGMVDYQSVEKAYGLKFNKKACFHLPMFGEQFIEPRRLDSNGMLNILTVSRADFPFKGYLLGIVELFEKLSKINSNLRLTIISYGKDINQLKKAIEKCENEVRQKIRLVGPIGYEEVKKEIADTAIYIGMGTTILDAAKFGKPCIAVETFTQQLSNTFMWNEHFDYLCSDGIEGRDGFSLVNELIQMSDETYKNVCVETYKKFCDFYEIEKTMSRICMYASQQNKLEYNIIQYYISWFIYKLFEKIRRLCLQ